MTWPRSSLARRRRGRAARPITRRPPPGGRAAPRSAITRSSPRLPFVGLTGGLGAGKSTALAALERLGAATLSSDAVVHELYASGELRDAVVGRWGADVAPGGRVDRAAVAARAFASEDERSWLEGLIWPRVGERIVAWREEVRARTPRPRAAVIEVPLLFEAGMQAAFDATIAVVADERVRTARARGRGHAALDERSLRQLAQEEKARRATHTVVNDGSVDDLQRALSVILEKLSP